MINNEQETIDLQRFVVPGGSFLNTRSWGIKVRNESQIDDIEKRCDRVIIHIPSEADNITTSFFEEFLESVVVKLGEEGFRKKFEFKNSSSYRIEHYLSEAIKRILREDLVYA